MLRKAFNSIVNYYFYLSLYAVMKHYLKLFFFIIISSQKLQIIFKNVPYGAFGNANHFIYAIH